ncbi:MAG: family 43 glycosylhydrolase [Prevotella sp.]|jgi:hypothetical protein|nr:family 43 glycosylhydrolase [Prevotella sp.]
MSKYSLYIIIILLLSSCGVQKVTKRHTGYIHNGIPWFDDKGNIVNAHGACIIEDNGRYYLFGEYKSNGENAFYGFSCYSSDDLVTWKFEDIVLGVQPDGILGPKRIGERVKVMKCPSTGEYVMYMHCDDMGYTDPHIGYATSKTINGEYTFQGPILHGKEPIRRWDMGTFQDTDGTGYLLIHHGIIYRLSKDYRSAEAKVLDNLPDSGESPAMLKKNGIYYMLNSDLTSWERNDNYYFTATAIKGPWKRQGYFAPKGTLTYNSQCSFVLPVIQGNETTYMYMGDRWSFPKQADAATHVWLPLLEDNGKLSIPEYWEAWDINTLQKIDPLAGSKIINEKQFKFSNASDWKNDDGKWVSNTKGSYIETTFKGTQFAIIGESNSTGGYARISILNSKEEVVHSSLVDFYSKVADDAVRFMSPQLPKDTYIIRVEVTGIVPEWFQKSGERLGSTGCAVAIKKLVVFE